MSDLPLAIGISLSLTCMLGLFSLTFPPLLYRAFAAQVRVKAFAYLLACVALVALFFAGAVMFAQMMEPQS